MAHMIENDMIAYKNETPWHGLGHRVDDNMTGAEMLKVAGLDWTVQRRALAMRGFNADGSLDTTKMLTEQLSGFKAIVRSDNNQVFCIPTKKYQVVQNLEVVDMFREYCEAGHAQMDVVGGLRNGAVVWASAKLSDTGMTLRGGDTMNGNLLMVTSHDGTLITQGKATSTRTVCQNTLSAALIGGSSFKMKHTSKFTQERKDEAKAAIGIAITQVQKLHKAAEILSNVNIDHSDWLTFMGKLMGTENVLDPKTAQLTRTAEDIQLATMTSPGAQMESAKGTLWGAVNGVSYFTDHQRGRSQDSRLASAWFGDSDLLKRTAVNVALEMAGVSM